MGATLTLLPDGRVLLWNLAPCVEKYEAEFKGLLELAQEDNIYAGWLEYWRGDDND